MGGLFDWGLWMELILVLGGNLSHLLLYQRMHLPSQIMNGVVHEIRRVRGLGEM